MRLKRDLDNNKIQVNKVYYSIRNKTVADILSEYRSISERQFQRSYQIKFNKDGTVFDKENKTCYNSLHDWAKTVLETGEYYETFN